jgi:tRNA(Ile)-lysidine synthase TilS/MesJ
MDKIEKYENDHILAKQARKHSIIKYVYDLVPIVDGPVGVSCSGGADSSILLYLLMKHTSHKIYIFTTGDNQKNRKNVLAATRVIEKCIELTGNSNIEHHISYTDVHSWETTFPKLERYLLNGDVDCVYTGITSNPPESQLTPNKEINRDPSIEKRIWYLGNHACSPFYNIDKKKISQLYKQEGLIDTLFPLTRSCETIDDIGLNHCGNCWWCKEREWAFGRL